MKGEEKEMVMRRLIFALMGCLLGVCLSYRSAGAEPRPASIVKVQPLPVLRQTDRGVERRVNVNVEARGETAEYEFLLTSNAAVNSQTRFKQTLVAGPQAVECWVVQGDPTSQLQVKILRADTIIAQADVEPKPVRPWVIYLQCHSHVDIGYTDPQPDCDKHNWKCYEQAIAESQRTADYPPDAVFKWNVEVLWSVKSYLAQAAPEKRQAFIDAVNKGWIGLEGLYANMLTGLCRPEEFLHVLDAAESLKRQYGFQIDSAMMTDVPGLTWGLVPVLAQGGVHYLSSGPNEGCRIGQTRQAWDQRPFYWVSPDGKHRILHWQTANGYGREFKDEKTLWQFLERLEDKYGQYPYDMISIRHCRGDNSFPDTTISDQVRDFNSRYLCPQFVITTTSRMMHDFENRYGDSIPAVAGDFTPYWEDGAASSARETALNRATADRLVQTETLWAMFNPKPFPRETFEDAWQNVLLYSEHTWGAKSWIRRNSFKPGSKEYLEQWHIKQAFALDADKASRVLLDEALAGRRAAVESIAAVDVFNTASWPRTELIILPLDYKLPGDVVKTPDGRQVPSQRLSTGELAFLAEYVPPLGTGRFVFYPSAVPPAGLAHAKENQLGNGRLEITVNPNTGSIDSVFSKSLNASLVDREKGFGWNEYFYVPGENPADALRAGATTVTVQDAGPLVATLKIDSDPPGCRHLTRTLRLIDGLDRLEIANLVDKEEIPVPDLVKTPPRKEGVYFGFPFAVADPVVRMETPWAVVRLETEQLPGACRDWYTVQRWIDVSNQDYGLTLATPDAPLAEFGKIADQRMATKHIDQTGVVYSYIMNNYWETNYQHSQGGKVLFRYAVLPHHRFESAAATRFGIEQSQPLIPVPVADDAPVRDSFLRVEPAGIMITSIKPARDNAGLIVRLFNASAGPQTAALTPPDKNSHILLSNPAEEDLAPLPAPTLNMLPYESITLRIKP